MLSVTNKTIMLRVGMLSVYMLNVIMLIVAAPMKVFNRIGLCLTNVDLS
jgi:hypothetical protein